jgi:hypothetical protein
MAMNRIVANDPGDLLSMADVLSMSGLEFMQGMLEGRLPGPAHRADHGL